jgi:hypothetical protein
MNFDFTSRNDLIDANIEKEFTNLKNNTFRYFMENFNEARCYPQPPDIRYITKPYI